MKERAWGVIGALSALAAALGAGAAPAQSVQPSRPAPLRAELLAPSPIADQPPGLEKAAYWATHLPLLEAEDDTPIGPPPADPRHRIVRATVQHPAVQRTMVIEKIVFQPVLMGVGPPMHQDRRSRGPAPTSDRLLRPGR